LILQSESFPNARRLAEACAVSRRTIYRDLATLEAAGIDVLYQPQRQGYQLARESWLQPTQLSDHEALALLIMSRADCVQLPFGLLQHARSGLAKVVQSLAGELCGRITISRELIAESPPPMSLDADRQSIHETILNAMSQRRRLSLWHCRDEHSSSVQTKLSLYRLARVRGQWSLVGHSSADREVRVFPIPSIERLELTDQPYSIPPRFHLERYLEKSCDDSPSTRRAAQLRFTPRVARAVREVPVPRDQRFCAGPDGAIDLFLAVDGFEQIVSWLIGFGDQVEVLEPAELRRAVRDWAERIARIHSRPRE